MNLSQMADLGGVRAVLLDQAAANRIAAQLRKNWTLTRTRDYVAKPKGDGYRALHLINRNRGHLIEVQLRTPRQDNWANSVEMFSRSIAPGLKFGGGPEQLREFFFVLGEIYACHDRGVAADPALSERLQALWAEVDTFVEERTNES